MHLLLLLKMIKYRCMGLPLLLLYHSTIIGVQSQTSFTPAEAKIAERCYYCHIAVRDFQSGYDATIRDNFGGGNTRWEESRLGSYATSETRLMQIMERLCQNESSVRAKTIEGADSKTRCHRFVEEIEEIVEIWWLNDWASKQQSQGKDDSSQRDSSSIQQILYQHLCVEKLSVCCPSGHFGASCTPCEGLNAATGHICSSHGICHGNETRIGTGRCQCEKGYVGNLCQTCDKGHFQQTVDGNITCRPCHGGCSKDGCTGPGPGDCHSCASGWNLSTDQTPQICVDIDECNPPSGIPPCSANFDTFCENLPGSFRCRRCHESCASGKGCIGPNANHCRACNTPGFEWNAATQRCEDVDECGIHDDVCSVEGQRCRNTQGSYVCECLPGMEVDYDLNKCVTRSLSRNRNQGQSRKKKKDIIIWTVPFTLEFLKLFGACVAFCLVIQVLNVKMLQRFIVPMSLGVIGLSMALCWFVYQTGISLERLHAKTL